VGRELTTHLKERHICCWPFGPPDLDLWASSLAYIIVWSSSQHSTSVNYI